MSGFTLLCLTTPRRPAVVVSKKFVTLKQRKSLLCRWLFCFQSLESLKSPQSPIVDGGVLMGKCGCWNILSQLVLNTFAVFFSYRGYLVYELYIHFFPIPLHLKCSCRFLKLVFIYLCLAALSHRCFPWTFSNCGKQKLPFFVGCRLLLVVASTVMEQDAWAPAAVLCEPRHTGWVALHAACGIFVNEGSTPYPLHWKVQICFLLISSLCGNYC